MRLVDKLGNAVNIPNENVPQSLNEVVFDTVALISDDLVLKPIWEAVVKRITKFECEVEAIEVEEFSHEPTEEELMYLLAKNRIYRDGYVTVTKGYKFCEE